MRMLKETLCVLLLWASLEATQSRGCSSFFCRKSHRVSMLSRGADPGKPLFLTPYLEKGNIEEARKQSLVGPLPGANVKSYAGYLTVNKKYNSNLYFWFFPAQEWPETAPVLLWLQGGPGGTSMFGLFVEHGPYFVLKNLTVGYRDYPWTSRYSVLYIDNPVGTGFSFTDDDRGFAQNQDDVGRDLYSALTQFFQIFSEYQSNDFYATGESYAGKYVPAIGYYIHKHNPIAKVKINFKGVAIGDGLCDPELMLGGYGDFLYQTGLIDMLQKQYVEQQTASGVQLIQQEKWVEAFEVFDSLLNGDILPYPSFFQNATGCTNYFNYLQCQEPADQEYFSQFVTLAEVRRSIHVGNLTFHDGSEVEKHLLQDVMKSIKPWLATLMDNYRVLIYSGQLDVIVAAPLTERFLPTVNWTGADEFNKASRFHWKIQPEDTEVAGYVRQVGEFYQVIVRGGGHILPYDQPQRSFDMIDRFLSTQGFI
ncbi:putative serine carboxypeptidase CPVL [Oncorhynchus kisutch]|uniref:Probable serine carboxypeptidase CPVL n=1 Tax=Oncorhynchus kisutch TaxID=8019 RepID=A0A8C7LF03_ONCKI|nr:probable serine carboxypeptidase CPVL [Oncorhynchus kisutch]XP_031667944.1 probable serine carboxypeptidase CPVL [Oncorhynchus kisutch]